MRKLVKSSAMSASVLTMMALCATPIASAETSSTNPATTTPIQHVVVIFDENISFDHYFGTYPNATNPNNEPPFFAAPGTPTVNGLTGPLLTNNPNGTNPQRLDRTQPVTQDNNHGYTAEQTAQDNGKMDNFINGTGGGNRVVLNYYDGNTVTALWNYAQHFSLNDNSFGTTFGPSSVGAINLISGQTAGAIVHSRNSTNSTSTILNPGDSGFPKSVTSNGVLIGDQDPYFDNASKGPTIEMTGQNVGDLLNAKGVTWGWFQGGFANTSGTSNNVAGSASSNYSAHHEPFQYYKSTANPNHLPPTSTAMIGQTDQANHQYDLTNFWAAMKNGNMPAVSFLKAPSYEDGHAGYSDPLDEQNWLVNTINQIEASPAWSSTAIFISWDDSDGWYDHVAGPLVNGSNDPAVDTLAGEGNAGTPTLGTTLDRAGYGPRIPMLVISPYAKHNFVDNTLTDQTSILRFIEDNWSLGQIGNGSYDSISGSVANMFDWNRVNPPVFLDPSTGEPVSPDQQPEVVNGVTYLSAKHYTQDLNTSFVQKDNAVWFHYNGHSVEIPMHGSSAIVDGNTVDLLAPLRTENGALMIPVDTLDNYIDAQLVEYTSGHSTFYLFDPNN